MPTDIKPQTHTFLVNSCLENLLKNKPFDFETLFSLHAKFAKEKNLPYVSIIMSYLAIINYKKDKNYYKAVALINDAKYLVNSSNCLLAKKINLFCSAFLEKEEENYNSALVLLRASHQIKIDEMIFLDKEILKQIKKLEPKKSAPARLKEEDETLLAFLEVGRTIAVETNLDNLLTIIAEQIQHALRADRCTVFLYDEKNHELWSKVALGLEMKELRFDADKGLAGHVLKTGETVNIKNAYKSIYFNKEIDLKTGYKTKNILCMPIRNLSHEIMGVFQVLNKFDGEFSQKDEDLLMAIGASAGIAIENANLFNEQKKLIEEQKRLFSSFIDTLAASIDARDKITSGHSKRVTNYAELICDIINLSFEQKEIIKSASMLHDIGKIGIKDSVLQKEGKLTDEEYAHIKQHVLFTYDILKNVYISKEFALVTEIAASHHEKFDGTGYFKGLKGDEIPLGGRILAICDVFDAITSKRHYRSKMKIVDALKIIVQGANTHFDSNLVEAFMDIKPFDILRVMDEEMFKPNKTDEIILKKFKLRDLYAILLNNSQNELTQAFNNYY